ncbi:MAG: DNA polymerase I [Candidatus Tectomicrobia bacterium]|nr:DNA polymerase I [Candidatus Tectomicrobia bacterium]
MGGRKKLCIIDGFSYVFRAFFAIRQYLSNSRGQPTNAIYGFLSMLQRVINEEQPDCLAVALESKEPTFRHEAYDAYKANRPEMPADLAQQLPYIFRLIEAFNIRGLSAARYEADDVIATVARRAVEEGFDVTIISGDKDLLQLVGPRLRMLDTMTNKLWDEAAVKERWGVAPEQIQDLLGLMGDSVDNVPGVPGIGEKTAVALLQEYGDLETLLAKADTVQRKNVRENLRTYAEQARLSKALVGLERNVPLEIAWEELAARPADRARLIELYRELEFVTHLRDLTGRERSEADGGEPAAVCIDTRETLAAWIEELRRAAAVGLALLADGNPLADGRLVGLALAAADGAAAYVPLGQAGAGAQLEAAEVLPQVVALLAGYDGRLACHDVKQARHLLGAAGHALPDACFDTMLAAYLLGVSRAPYRLEDMALELLAERIVSEEDVRGKGAKAQPFAGLAVERAAAHAVSAARALVRLRPVLEERLRADDLEDLFTTVEAPLAAVLAEMEEAGVKVDVQRLRQYSQRLNEEIAAKLERIFVLAKGEFKVDSPKQLAEVLFERLGLKPLRKTKTGYSTDMAVLEELALQHPLPAVVLEYRQLAKLKSTYLDALPNLVNPRTGRIHTSFNQAVAATGRLSSSDPNLQNIPIRGDGREIRRAFVAEPGHLLLSADYSQIELRVLAHLSGDERLLDAFQRGEDIHTRTASEVFLVPPERVNEEMRRRAKTVNFGIIYGLSPFGLARSLGIEVGDARRFIDLYFARYEGVKGYLDGIVATAHRQGYVTTLLRRRRYLPDLQSKNRTAQQAAERTAINTPIQGSAADIIKLAMLAVHRRLRRDGLRARMLLQVHDELLFEVPEAELPALTNLVRAEMEGATQLVVPLKVELGHGPSWYEAH